MNEYATSFGNSAADALPEKRAQFIRKTYLLLASAILAFIAVEAFLFITPAAGLIATVIFSGGAIGWLLVLRCKFLPAFYFLGKRRRAVFADPNESVVGVLNRCILPGEFFFVLVHMFLFILKISMPLLSRGNAKILSFKNILAVETGLVEFPEKKFFHHSLTGQPASRFRISFFELVQWFADDE